MTNEERDIIAGFIARVAGAPQPGQPAPAPLPPLDPEADALIAQLCERFPEARYRLAQMALVQEHALVEAQNRIARLQTEVQQARQAAAPPPAPGASPWAAPQQAPQPRGFFSSLFGNAPAPQGGSAYAPPPVQPPAQAPAQFPAQAPAQYPPGYNPGMFQPSGTGFLGTALRTAAGVAGGILAADAISSLFSGRSGGGWGVPPAEAVEYVVPVGGNPWAAAAPIGAPVGAPDPYDVGGAPKEPLGDKFSGSPVVDQGAWTPAPPDSSGGWDQASNDPGGNDPGGNDPGWDTSTDDGGGFDDTTV
jgi:uncharacterized protein